MQSNSLGGLESELTGQLGFKVKCVFNGLKHSWIY